MVISGAPWVSHVMMPMDASFQGMAKTKFSLSHTCPFLGQLSFFDRPAEIIQPSLSGVRTTLVH